MTDFNIHVCCSTKPHFIWFNLVVYLFLTLKYAMQFSQITCLYYLRFLSPVTLLNRMVQRVGIVRSTSLLLLLRLTQGHPLLS